MTEADKIVNLEVGLEEINAAEEPQVEKNESEAEVELDIVFILILVNNILIE